jgi:hypothetical protein
MSAINSTYNLDIASLVPHFDRGIQHLVKGLTLARYGSQWDAIDTEVQRLPAVVNAANANAVKIQLEGIITELRATDIAKADPAFQTELNILQNILDRGVNQPATKVEKVKNCSCRLIAYLWSYVRTPAAPAATPAAPNQTHNVALAFNRLKADLTNLTPVQKSTLVKQPKNSGAPADFAMKVKYEITAQTFNIATIIAIRAIVYGVLGIMGFKTMLVTAAAFYILREIADRSMSVTSYESWMKVPVIVPLGVPYAPVTSYLIPGVNVPIPTIKGVGQLATRAYNYTKLYLYNGNGGTFWRPNFLEFNGIAILKNGIIPLSHYPAAFHRATL